MEIYFSIFALIRDCSPDQDERNFNQNFKCRILHSLKFNFRPNFNKKPLNSLKVISIQPKWLGKSLWWWSELMGPGSSVQRQKTIVAPIFCNILHKFKLCTLKRNKLQKNGFKKQKVCARTSKMAIIPTKTTRHHRSFKKKR